MFKLAELLWEESRRLYLIKMEDYGRALEKCAHTKGDCDQPRSRASTSRGREALPRAARQVSAVPPHGPRHVPDRLRGQGGQPRGRGDGAVPGGHRAVPAVAAVRRRVDDGRRALLRADAVGEGERGVHAHPPRRGDERPRDVQDRVVRLEARQHRPGRERLQARARQGRRGRAHRHRGAAPPQRLAARRGARVPRRRVHRGQARSRRRRSSTSSRRSAASATRATSSSRSPRATPVRPSGSAATRRSGSSSRWIRTRSSAPTTSATSSRTGPARSIVEQAQDEIKVLLDDYGPATAWAKAQKNRDALDRSLQITEELVRVTATNLHGEAQRREKLLQLPQQNGCATRPPVPRRPLALYRRPPTPTSVPPGVWHDQDRRREGDRGPLLPRRHPVLQARQARGRRRRVPQRRQERAGRQVSQGGAARRDERVRARAPQGHERPHQLYPVDKKFGEAIDLYATLFPPTRISSA